MIDKFGRSIIHTEIDGRHNYSVAGKFSFLIDSEDGALAHAESFLPDDSEYSSMQCDFVKYAKILERDHAASTYGGELKAKFVGSLALAREAMRAMIFGEYNLRMEEVFLLYPKYEPSTWAIQKIQAVNWYVMTTEQKDATIASYGNPLNQFTLLLAIAKSFVGVLSREVVDGLVQKIAVNGWIFEVYCGELTGYKAKICVQLDQAQTVSDFLSIDAEFSQIQHLMERTWS